jgi:hypothetical protein
MSSMTTTLNRWTCPLPRASAHMRHASNFFDIQRLSSTQCVRGSTTLQVGSKSDARIGQRSLSSFPLSVLNIGTPEPCTSYVACRLTQPLVNRLAQETIPHQYRSIVGICNLLCPILNSSATQKILFPPHHQDPPDAVPKCKGFALVALTEPTIASRLLSLFSYDSGNTHHPTGSFLEESGAREEGFCSLSKERWDKLQAEYAEYRESLLHRVAADSTSPTTNNINSTHGSERTLAPAPTSQSPQSQTYPAGCVLFARYVLSDTNKTTLRTPFSALLGDTAALNYVDYTKGPDSVRVPFLCRLLLELTYC